ncbi:glycerol uptake facilitator protein [Pilibacter termitis]|uniref:Glycerol uptake facilitator protein n=1 Tax=Pilibacter termitis TaxID=263852 RepID=A0A1T4MJF1_9ENTE|nr:MIP/aquaporin family protein [Pilibacter termitis]SJZ67102.1 glycerol uptake facilitator protein [Pilibacter termitis]
MNNAVLGEFIGTFVLIFFGTGVGCSINLNKTLAKAVGANWVLVAFGWGIAVMLGVYTAIYFNAPAHLNPAVTLSFAIGGITDWSQVLTFILAQLGGAFLGATVATIHYLPHFAQTKSDEGNSVGIFATGPAIPNTFFNLISEIIATFAFVFTLLLLPADFAPSLKPLVLAFLLVGISFSFGSTTGYAINPARDFAPRLAYTVLPIANKGDSNWGYAWIPIVGPIIGAIVAVTIVNLF